MRWSALVLVACLVACRQDMHDQPKLEPYERSPLFADGRAMRPTVEGTVARGRLREDDHLYRGRVEGELATAFPFPVDRAVLERGRERYGIFCAPCHGLTGDGDGMIVRRGFKRPPSFHEQRLRDAPPGHFFDVVTNGYGVMYDHGDRIPPRDRWRITAWVRVLQRSRTASLDDVPPEERAGLEELR